jgi:hypothetical protein
MPLAALHRLAIDILLAALNQNREIKTGKYDCHTYACQTP